MTGEGADLNNEKSIKDKAKRKMITQTMVLNLIDVSKNKKNPRPNKKVLEHILLSKQSLYFSEKTVWQVL